MNCDIVKDLIPLYIDGCCSDESTKAVEAHVKECTECKKVFDDMRTPTKVEKIAEAPFKFRKINYWKASILQSVLLFFSFALITIGVSMEASTAYDHLFNGFFAYNLVIPATGFMLSLANWYFIRVYKTRKLFSNCSCLLTIFITICCYIWAEIHYEGMVIAAFTNSNVSEIIENTVRVLFVFGIGIFLTFLFVSFSKILSESYAKMLGKE